MWRSLKSRALPTTVVAVVRFPSIRQYPSIAKTREIQPPWPLKHLSRYCFPSFHSKSRSGTLEIQTASRPRQSVSRLETRRLVCSFCTAGTGPNGTLGLRYGGELAAENCWLALHAPTLHVQHHTLLFSATPRSKSRRRSPTEDRALTVLAERLGRAHLRISSDLVA